QTGVSTVISNTGRILADGTWEKGVIDRTTVRHITVSDLNSFFLVLNDYPAGSPLGPPPSE
ncbi:MAG TPA: hypothetical protein VLV86_25395, partial [Vicinamibacterales bacterium]|nr:hypothetical protein [Vicinamibacterales bacterium]